MREIYFGDFRKILIQHYKEIEAQNPEHQSIEWFLLRYLQRVEKSAERESSKGRVENSMRGFIRFYVDNIDENSLLGERCLTIYAEYRKTLRCYQQE